MKTEAELHFDKLVEQRRAIGRKTYGKGLDHTDTYDWMQMALEEALDLAQYLAAENLRLRDLLHALFDEADYLGGLRGETVQAVNAALRVEVKRCP